MINDEARRQLIKKAVEAVPANAERRLLPWRAGNLSLPVVEIPLTHVLLNPRSHRIKAQVKSLAASDQLATNDLFDEAGQAQVAKIIRETDGFEKVKAALRRDGQMDPGVITRDGVLINANTRAIALRDLKKDYIKVQVLPDDANEHEITELELSFQMQADVKQPYTFTNRLLFIRDLLDVGWDPAKIGLEMDGSQDKKVAALSVEEADRRLTLIETIVGASDGALTYADFDQQMQNIIEIEQAYEAMKKKHKIEVAERVRDAKIAAMLAGLGYQKIRTIDETYLDDYITTAIEEEKSLEGLSQVLTRSKQMGAGEQSGGLDLLDEVLGAAETADQVTLAPVYIALATTKKDADVTLELPNGSERTMSRDAFAASVRQAFLAAATNKELDEAHVGKAAEPARQLRLARAACDRATEALTAELSAADTFDAGELAGLFASYLRAHDEMVLVLERLGFTRPTD